MIAQETTQARKRQTAYKLRIGDILKAHAVMENERLKFIELGNKQISRVNVVANIVDKYDNGEKRYLSFTLDDASGQIRVKVFSDGYDGLKNFGQGDSVLVIGQVRIFGNETYIAPEIIKLRDTKYLLVRKLELELEIPKTLAKEEVKALREQISDMIKNGEDDGGVDVEKIILELHARPDLINGEIKKMLEEGLAYEPRPGKVRYLG